MIKTQKTLSILPFAESAVHNAEGQRREARQLRPLTRGSGIPPSRPILLGALWAWPS